MVFNIRSILLLFIVVTMTIYIILTAGEDSRSFEVTRNKHLIGFLPAALSVLMYVKDRSLFDIGMIVLFVLLCLFIGIKGIYGMADGFVFANLSLLFGGVGGTAGIGLVILIMILACFSGMTEMLLRKMVSLAAFRQNRHIAFVPHILAGYIAVMIALFIWF